MEKPQTDLVWGFIGSGTRIRTLDLVINSHPLYRWAMPELILFAVMRKFHLRRRENVRKSELHKKKKVLSMIFSHSLLSLH